MRNNKKDGRDLFSTGREADNYGYYGTGNDGDNGRRPRKTDWIYFRLGERRTTMATTILEMTVGEDKEEWEE